MPRPPGHGPDFEVRRQKIIDTAAELFARHGYAATSVNDLGRAVGLAKGALYYYIGCKENLLIEIQSRVMDPLLSRARQIAGLDADPLVRLRLLSESLLTIILRRLDHIWVYEHDYRHLRGANRTRLLRQRREFEKIVQDLLVEAMESGAFRKLNARLAMLQFLNMHNHTYQWAKPDGEWDAEFLSREYCATLISGFRSPSYDADDLEERVRSFREREGA